MTSEIAAQLDAVLSRQRTAQLRDGPPTLALRRDRLTRCIELLVDHRTAIEEALEADFGARSRQATMRTWSCSGLDAAAGIPPIEGCPCHR